eukprot:TRINITY_DN16071_c0_g1_i1.p1 TRINITY_DN16071_c0_g1~~TRINITY_DN16071_c0_g1_i1.p1  ORF type:complete len:338 (+),score=57.83 TRINITY_DN16071_c0_g1_i1:71-1084(+)
MMRRTPSQALAAALVGDFFAAAVVSLDKDISATIRIASPEGPHVLDESCWDSDFTIERCCLVSHNVSISSGCWTTEDNDTYEECCRGFVSWHPPDQASPLRKSYDLALAEIMKRENCQHEGMVFGRIASALGFTQTAEVGVLGGTWSEYYLAVATSVDGRLSKDAAGEIQIHTMVDLWINQPEKASYVDGSGKLALGRHLEKAVHRLQRFWPRVRFVQQASDVAPRLFDDGSLDFVFIDARHDEYAVWQDMLAWWPKLRQGGLLAGDDYLDAAAAREVYESGWAENDWSICESGEVRPGAVKGAVNGFAAAFGLPVNLFRLPRASLSPQWLIFKPFK